MHLARILIDRLVPLGEAAVHPRLWVRTPRPDQPGRPRRPKKGYYPARAGAERYLPLSPAAVVRHLTDLSARASDDGEVLFTRELGFYTVAAAGLELRPPVEKGDPPRASGIELPAPAVTRALCWDIDGTDWPTAAATARRLLGILDAQEMPGLLERSRGGGGAHVWCLLDGDLPARLARACALALAREAQVPLRRAEHDGRAVDLVYPQQIELTSDAPLGSLLALPLGAEPRERGCAVFYAPSSLAPIGGGDLTAQVGALAAAPRTTRAHLEALAAEWRLDLGELEHDEDEIARRRILGEAERAGVRTASDRVRARRPARPQTGASAAASEPSPELAAAVELHPDLAALHAKTEDIADRSRHDYALAAAGLRAGLPVGLVAELLWTAPGGKACQDRREPRYVERTIAAAATRIAAPSSPASSRRYHRPAQIAEAFRLADLHRDAARIECGRRQPGLYQETDEEDGSVARIYMTSGRPHSDPTQATSDARGLREDLRAALAEIGAAHVLSQRLRTASRPTAAEAKKDLKRLRTALGEINAERWLGGILDCDERGWRWNLLALLLVPTDEHPGAARTRLAPALDTARQRAGAGADGGLEPLDASASCDAAHAALDAVGEWNTDEHVVREGRDATHHTRRWTASRRLRGALARAAASHLEAWREKHKGRPRPGPLVLDLDALYDGEDVADRTVACACFLALEEQVKADRSPGWVRPVELRTALPERRSWRLVRQLYEAADRGWLASLAEQGRYPVTAPEVAAPRSG